MQRTKIPLNRERREKDRKEREKRDVAGTKDGGRDGRDPTLNREHLSSSKTSKCMSVFIFCLLWVTLVVVVFCLFCFFFVLHNLKWTFLPLELCNTSDQRKGLVIFLSVHAFNLSQICCHQKVLAEIIIALLTNEMVITWNQGTPQLTTEKMSRDPLKMTECVRWLRRIRCTPQLFLQLFTGQCSWCIWNPD